MTGDDETVSLFGLALPADQMTALVSHYLEHPGDRPELASPAEASRRMQALPPRR
jgi:hypothetical protein